MCGLCEQWVSNGQVWPTVGVVRKKTVVFVVMEHEDDLHTHTRMHARTHTHTHTRTHARTHTRTHTHTHTQSPLLTVATPTSLTTPRLLSAVYQLRSATPLRPFQVPRSDCSGRWHLERLTALRHTHPQAPDVQHGPLRSTKPHLRHPPGIGSTGPEPTELQAGSHATEETRFAADGADW